MGIKEKTGRRSFLKAGTTALAGAFTGLQQGLTVFSEPKMSVRTSNSQKMVGCYSSVDEILKNPKYIDALQQKLGVNFLLCGSSIKMPEWLRGKNPLKNGMMHTQHTDDDSALISAIEETKKRGMKFWLYFSGHHNSEDERGVMSETFEGIKFADLPPIKYCISQGELTTCFQKPAVREYETALFGFASKNYEVDKMYVSHTRYATPSFWTNLFGCACSSCREEAYRLGYDFEKMKNSMQALKKSLENLNRKTIENAAKAPMTFADFLSFTGENNGVADWLYCRAKIVGNALKNINDTVHLSTNERCGFVTDTHNAAMSLLIGHNFEDFINGASDNFHPLSWCDYQHVSVVAAWANQLCEWAPGLEEKTALKVAASFFGWQDIGLPSEKISDLRIAASPKEYGIWGDPEKNFYSYFNPDLTIKLMIREWTKLAAINRGRIPAHPVIKGFEWPEKVCRELMERTIDIGLNGYVFQRTENLIDKNKL